MTPPLIQTRIEQGDGEIGEQGSSGAGEQVYSQYPMPNSQCPILNSQFPQIEYNFRHLLLNLELINGCFRAIGNNYDPD
ncbi:hypothetical protein NIES4103_51090 [Nostoc sp. NIES-4103]|nr:hypothetical protein NIES4103_51090 [Nostoc sp. NIES-4103]